LAIRGSVNADPSVFNVQWIFQSTTVNISVV